MIFLPHNGTNIYSIISGTVTYTGFKGSGGCTITMENKNITVSYCHVSPNYLVTIGDKIDKGNIIGNVGPKIIYDIPNNPYKDKQGNPTNRCYYWMSFTFNNKKRRHSRQSFKLF